MTRNIHISRLSIIFFPAKWKFFGNGFCLDDVDRCHWKLTTIWFSDSRQKKASELWKLMRKEKDICYFPKTSSPLVKFFFFLIKSYQLLTEFAVWVDICKIVPCKFPWPIFRYKWFPEGRLQMNATLSLQTLSNKARRDWEIHSWTTFTISFVVFIGRTNKLSFLLWSLLLSPGVFVLGFHLFP